MRRRLSILGSTGSIGRQALELCGPLGIEVKALCAHSSEKLLEEQARRYKPEIAVLYDEAAANRLRLSLADTPIRVLSGMEGLCEAARLPGADTVLTALVGMVGLLPTLEAVRAKKRVALANKETLVCGGELVMGEAARYGAEIIPVDSEHSAIFQCLKSGSPKELKRLILTASGGPFFGRSRSELESITKAQALRHPNWSMGEKISVDSATMMNKGLELIEAIRLFSVGAHMVDIVVHRQSIVHSLVEFIDSSVIAQLSLPDMRLPIAYALGYPERRENPVEGLDLLSCGPLSFEAPDEEAFPCLALAKAAAKTGGTACTILNAANEAAVRLFLEEKISFLAIPDLVGQALSRLKSVRNPSLEDILEADRAARKLLDGSGPH